LAIWAYLVFGRGAFWRVSRLRAPAAAAPHPPGRVAVVIAARNEADVIGRSIASLLNQSCRASLHIFLVDDSSTDGSGQIARQAACRAGNEASLTVMEAGPVPPRSSSSSFIRRDGLRNRPGPPPEPPAAAS
jgi:cellulose synthase/poly-beta-1,6-N-acetylglucosamine synthase-like glycosyltransferase